MYYVLVCDDRKGFFNRPAANLQNGIALAGGEACSSVSGRIKEQQ
jgi:hypothetical protein